MTGRLDEEFEVGPIVFRSEGGLPPDDGVDHIILPREPRSFAPRESVSAEPEAPDAPLAPRRRKGLTRGLALGLIAGAAVGGAATLALRRAHQPPPAPRRPAGQVLIQAMRQTRGAASIPAAPAPEPQQRAAPATPAPRADKPASGGIDLDSLARAIAEATPPPAANDAALEPPPSPVEPPRPAPVIVARAPPPPPPVTAAPKLESPRPPPRFDPELALAERELALAYDRAMASAPDRAALHADQQRWLAQKDRAGSDRNAVLRLYQARTDALIEQDRVERKKGGIARLLRD